MIRRCLMKLIGSEREPIIESRKKPTDATSEFTEKERWVLRGGIGFFQKLDLGIIEPDGPDLDHFVGVLNGEVEPCTSEEIAYLKLRRMDEDVVRMVLTDHVGETIAKHRQVQKRMEEESSSEFDGLYIEPDWGEPSYEDPMDEVDDEEQKVISEDLFHDSLELARSNEDGWPYDDEDY